MAAAVTTRKMQGVEFVADREELRRHEDEEFMVTERIYVLCKDSLKELTAFIPAGAFNHDAVGLRTSATIQKWHVMIIISLFFIVFTFFAIRCWHGPVDW